jgi:hypothetical protein
MNLSRFDIKTLQQNLESNCKSIVRLLKFETGKFKFTGFIDKFDTSADYSPDAVNYKRTKIEKKMFAQTVLNLLEQSKKITLQLEKFTR